MKNTITELNFNEIEAVSGGEWLRYVLACATPIMVGGILVGIYHLLTKPAGKRKTYIV